MTVVSQKLIDALNNWCSKNKDYFKPRVINRVKNKEVQRVEGVFMTWLRNFKTGKWQFYEVEGKDFSEVYIKLFDDDGNHLHDMHLIPCDNCYVGNDAQKALLTKD